MTRNRSRNSKRTRASKTANQGDIFSAPIDLTEMYMRTALADKAGRVEIDESHLGVQIYAAVTVIPNQTATEIAKTLGVTRDSVVSMLATMEGLGLLLAEDEQGRLTPYRQADRPIIVGSAQ